MMNKCIMQHSASQTLSREDSEPAPIDDDWVDITPPNHNDVRVAIQQLKTTTLQAPAGLFKAGVDELVRSMHQIICRIWLEEIMPSDWNLSCLRQLSGYKRSPYRI